jgi:hypothetical protein
VRKPLLYGSVLLLLVACGGQDSGNSGASVSRLEETLSANTVWPHEVVGILDIVEAGGYDNSEYPSWAVGSLLTNDDDEGLSISIGEGVVSHAKIDIGSGKKVRVWLNAPKLEYGIETFPISRIQSQ